MLALPSATGALVCSFILPDDVVHTYAHGLSSICAEVVLKASDFFIFKAMRKSKAAFTAAMMLANALLLHGLRENTDGGFYWLIQPTKRMQFEDKACVHDNECKSYILEGMKSFAKFGVGLEIARGLIYNYSRLWKTPLLGMRTLVGGLNWNLIGFLVAYIGIYRVSSVREVMRTDELNVSSLLHRQRIVLWRALTNQMILIRLPDIIC